MRLSRYVEHDHGNMLGQTPEDHQPVAGSIAVIINSQSISSASEYEYRVSIGSGHKTARGVLRGSQTIANQGHAGIFFLASDTQDESIGISSAYSSPYAYMGCFSRLHGDSYLTRSIFGGDSIVLKDVWIDDDELVIVWYNPSGSSKNLIAYGTVFVK